MDVHPAVFPPPLLRTAEGGGGRLAQVDSQEMSAKVVWGHLDVVAVWGGQQSTWLTA